MRDAYREGRVLTAVNENSQIIGVIVWKQIEYEVDGVKRIYFGPFAVDVSVKGKGVGWMLIQEVMKIARSNGISELEISVVNHRVDLIPYYEKMGFSRVSTLEFTDSGLTRPSHFIVMRKSISF